MTFVNYKNSNNASSNLIADISASATVILITSGDQALFPTSFPFLLTIEKVNSDGNVIAREIVKATAGNQNSFTVVRGAGTCVQDDTASQRIQGSSSHSFSAGDKISLYRTAEQVKDIQDDLNSKLSIAEYQSGNYVYGASTTGNDDYAITLPVAPTAYTIGQVFRFLAGTGNTGPATLNVNGLGAVAIKKNHDVALDTGDIEEGQIVEVAYDGTNFQMNSQTATIVDMKDIKTTSYTGKAGQTLHEGDVVQIADHFDPELATETTGLGSVSALKGGIGFTANGASIKDLQIKAGIVSGTTPTAITVNLEADNNGSPSGTALGTVDILSSFSSTIDLSSMTETTTSTYYGNLIGTDSIYMGGGNRGKTRCFYVKQNSNYVESSQSLKIGRCMINKDTADANVIVYNFKGSDLASATGVSGNQSYATIYVDQDFKFMFVYQPAVGKIFKLGFNASASGGLVFNLETLGSRTPASVGTNGYSPMAFSDDGMVLYTISNQRDYAEAGIVRSYQLTAPYDLTGATEIGSSRTLGVYSVGPCYMSLGNGKKYIVAGYNNNRNIYAREINSDGTISSTSFTLKETSGSSTYFQYGTAIWNMQDGGAKLCIYYNSNSPSSRYYTPGTAYITSQALINFSFPSPIITTAGQKYWITIEPTGGGVQDYVNLSSYAGEENTSLSLYTDSWSASSNKSPYLRGQGVEALYILKQYDGNVAFGNYGVVDNEYEAFAQARFVNMGYSEHFTGLGVGRKYYMNNGELSTNGGQYLGIAINERTLQIGKGVDESSKLSNILAIPETSAQRTANTSYGNVVAKVDGYYTAMGNIQSSTSGARVRLYIDTLPVVETMTYRSTTGNETSFFMVSAYVKKGQTIGVGSSSSSYFSGVVIIGPDGSN